MTTPEGAVLIIGDTEVARRVCGALTGLGRPVLHLAQPSDRELVAACRAGLSAIAVLVRGDPAAVRYALAVGSLDPRVPMSVTVFDRTMADQLAVFLPQATVRSPADIAVPSLLGPCLGEDVVAARSSDVLGAWRVREVDGDLVSEPMTTRRPPRRQRLFNRLTWRVGSHDRGTRMLFTGLAGLSFVLVGDWLWLTLIEGHPWWMSLAEATSVVATVGPSADHPGATYAVLSSLAMLATIVLTAILTAGVVECLLEPRLLGFVGGRSVPRSGHVIVVGLGQVGLRLCAELKALGIPVLGVERDLQATHLRLARSLRIPVIIGHGGDRQLLQRARLKHARALAAVGSDDLDNVAVAVAAQGVCSTTPVVLRAGEHEFVAETRSLMPVGTTRDVPAAAAAHIVDTIQGGSGSEEIVVTNGRTLARSLTGVLRPVVAGARGECPHV